MTMKIHLTLLASLVGASFTLMAADALPLGHPNFLPSPAHPVGFRGDWTGSYPGATPPTRWSSTFNVLWEREVGVGEASPIVVGDRLFLFSNGVHLQCFDRHTGRLLWERLHHAKPAEGPAGLAWKLEEFVLLHHRGRPFREKITNISNKIAHIKKEADSRKAAPDLAEIAKLESALSVLRQGLAPIEQDEKAFPAKDLGIGGPWTPAAVTYAIATPCSDGKYVYAFLPIGEMVCYDLDGNLSWSRLLGDGPRWSAGWSGGHVVPSPCLADGKLVVEYDKMMQCLRADNGEPVWKTPVVTGGDKYASPFAGRVGTTWYVAEGSGPILRLADGKHVYQDTKNGCDVASSFFIDDLFHFRDHAVRVSANPDTPPVVAWRMSNDDITKMGGSVPHGGLHGHHAYAAQVHSEGRVYNQEEKGTFGVHDAKTGKILHIQKCSTGGEIYPGVIAAGNYLFTANCDGWSTVLSRFDGRECREVAQNRVAGYPGGNSWFFVGDRAYWRITRTSPDGTKTGRLFCIGDPFSGAPSPVFRLTDLDAEDDAVVWGTLRALKAKPDSVLVPELLSRLKGTPRQQHIALLALRALGPAAKDAAPVLAATLFGRTGSPPILNNDQVWVLSAHDALLAMGEAGVPAILAALPLKAYNESWNSCSQFAVKLLADMGPNAPGVVPTLLEMLATNEHWIFAAQTLFRISPDLARDRAVPILAAKILVNDPKNVNDHHRLQAINTLGDYGSLAAAALPALTAASENPNPDIKKAAIGAIAKVKAP